MRGNAFTIALYTITVVENVATFRKQYLSSPEDVPIGIIEVIPNGFNTKAANDRSWCRG